MMKNADDVKKVEEGMPAAPNTGGATLMEGDFGDVKIHENVIAALVSRATLQVEGVSRLAGSSLVDAIVGIVGNRRMQTRAISIDMSGENRVAVEVKVNLLFGIRVPDVAVAIQKSVISNIESVTGMTVTRVNILVQELEDKAEEPESADADAGTLGAACPMP